jgi:hypothetical protein
MNLMIEWPGRCQHCDEPIEDWTDAGLHEGDWIHKTCFAERRMVATQLGRDLPLLRSPLERASQLELPMLLFLLMFHFGLGGVLAGWVTLTQFPDQATTAYILLTVGIVVPLIGLIGVALNIVSRRRLESIRHAIDGGGGWQPGR